MFLERERFGPAVPCLRLPLAADSLLTLLLGHPERCPLSVPGSVVSAFPLVRGPAELKLSDSVTLQKSHRGFVARLGFLSSVVVLSVLFPSDGRASASFGFSLPFLLLLEV